MSTWIKLDTDCFMHPKVVRLDDDVRWLWVAGLCYSGMHLTDGEIPSAALAVLSKSSSPDRAAGELVAAGLWELTDDGYRVVGYTDHQRSRSDVDKVRERNRQRQRRYRESQTGTETPTSRRDSAVTNALVTAKSRDQITDVDEDVDTPTQVDLGMYRGGPVDQAAWVKQTLDAYRRQVRSTRASLPAADVMRRRAGELFDHPAKDFTPELAARFMAAEAAGEPTASIWARVDDREPVR